MDYVTYSVVAVAVVMYVLYRELATYPFTYVYCTGRKEEADVSTDRKEYFHMVI